jgi:hypothetical protein
MKRLFVPGFLVLMTLSPAVAQAMTLRPVFQQGIPGVDENGEEFLAVPDTRGKATVWVVPLKRDPYFQYITPVLEQDLARKVRVEDTKNLILLQIGEQEWEWHWELREDAAVGQEKAGEQADAEAKHNS